MAKTTKTTKKVEAVVEDIAPVIDKETPRIVVVKLDDRYNKNMVLYFDGRNIQFKDGEAKVRKELAKALKQGGYVK